MDPHNIRLNEAKMGYGLGIFYGWPAWFGVPMFLVIGKGIFVLWERVLLLLPTVAALLLIVVGFVASRA